jgi:hypothetical protein
VMLERGIGIGIGLAIIGVASVYIWERVVIVRSIESAIAEGTFMNRRRMMAPNVQAEVKATPTGT